jgi:ubiquinone/menaquinone biosynthesis C-methylase UbiE
MEAFDDIRISAPMLRDYYRKRAAEYDAFYDDPARQAELATLRDWLAGQTRGRRILEVAAGTGYWTVVAAPAAALITATDVNAEPLAIARGKLHDAKNVTLLQADAWALPTLPGTFDAGMAHLWWSHVRRQDRAAFLARFASCLEPGATLLMIDENPVAKVGSPISRRDADGNTWQWRWLATGEQYEIVKNYFEGVELEASVSASCEDIQILQLRYFWALAARFGCDRP